MSKSKIVMYNHLSRVQCNLMGMSFDSITLDTILPIIFKECLKEDMTFWFSFIENTGVLNLRDIFHENYELNIRLHHQHQTIADYEEIKKQLLINTFLITSKPVKIASSAKNTTSECVISNDTPVPPHIREAIKKIESKGIPVTREAIQNHLPTGKMSTSARIECNNYLKTMEAAQ